MFFLSSAEEEVRKEGGSRPPGGEESRAQEGCQPPLRKEDPQLRHW